MLLGAPHSGIETLARAFEAAGAVPVDAAGDPSEFGAPMALSRLSQTILEALGVDPANPGPLLVGGMTHAQSRAEIVDNLWHHHGRDATRLIEEAITAGETALLVDPRIALILPLWRRALAEAGARARFVYVHRSPLAIAELARQASRQPPRRVWFLWHYLALEALEAAPNMIVVPARGLSDDPRAAARAIVPGLPAAGRGAVEPLRPDLRDDAPLDDAPLLSDQGRALHRLLESWSGLEEDERVAAVADLRERFDEAMLVAGQGRPARLTEVRARTAPLSAAPGSQDGSSRPLILHYHLFKNAGSSIDAMLKANFGDRWIEHEFPPVGRQKNLIALAAFLEEQAHLDAFSSHTMLLPPPHVEGRSIVPILFVRHPLTRLRSAYSFERRQTASTTGARLAKEHDFAGYVTTMLDEPRNRQARDFQTFRFSFGTEGEAGNEAERAMKTVTALPFIGLVEDYDRSVARLTDLLKPLFSDFAPLIVRRNAENAGDTRTINEKVAQIRDELGDALFERLMEANQSDLTLFHHVAASYSPDVR